LVFSPFWGEFLQSEAACKYESKNEIEICILLLRFLFCIRDGNDRRGKELKGLKNFSDGNDRRGKGLKGFKNFSDRNDVLKILVAKNNALKILATTKWFGNFRRQKN
jgi:hypothetical protein